MVDLEPELDGQPEPLGLQDDTDVCVEVERATLDVIRQKPDPAGLPEVVHMLREPDLVDTAEVRCLDEPLDRGDGVDEWLVSSVPRPA